MMQIRLPPHVRACVSHHRVSTSTRLARETHQRRPTLYNGSSNKADASKSGMVDCIQEQNNDNLTNTALAAVRHGLSNRGLAAVINGFQMDIDRVSSVKTKLLVDRKKIGGSDAG